MYGGEIKTAVYWILGIASWNKLLPSEINEQLSYCKPHTHSWFRPFGLIGLTLITWSHIGNRGAIEDGKTWGKYVRMAFTSPLLWGLLCWVRCCGQWALTGFLGLSPREWEATLRKQTWHLYEQTAAWIHGQPQTSIASEVQPQVMVQDFDVSYVVWYQMQSGESGLLAGLCSLVSERWWGSWSERDRCYHPGDSSSTSTSPAQKSEHCACCNVPVSVNDIKV